MILKSSIVILFIILSIVSKKDDRESVKINKIIRSTNVKNSNNLYPMVKKLNKDYYNIIIPEGISFEKVKDLESAISTGIKRNVLIENKDFKYSLTFPKESKLGDMYPIELIDYNDTDLKFPIGYDTDLNLVWLNLTKNPNGIFSGITSSGKSLFIHNMMLQLLNSYDMEFTHIDLKAGVELIDYSSLNCVRKFTYEPDEVANVLKEVYSDIFNRLHKIRSKGCRDHLSYNKKNKDQIKYHLVVIEELMVLGNDKEVMKILKKCLSICRATGTYFVITSQRFDVKTIEGSVKANCDIRLSFMVGNQTDSRVILDAGGAELLQNKGRCIYNRYGILKEIQCFYVDVDEIEDMLSKYPTKQKPVKTHEVKKVKSIKTSVEPIEQEKTPEVEERGWLC